MHLWEDKQMAKKWKAQKAQKIFFLSFLKYGTVCGFLFLLLVTIIPGADLLRVNTFNTLLNKVETLFFCNHETEGLLFSFHSFNPFILSSFTLFVYTWGILCGAGVLTNIQLVGHELFSKSNNKLAKPDKRARKKRLTSAVSVNQPRRWNRNILQHVPS